MKVYILISDFECSPTEISRILGLVPEKTFLKGDTITPSILKRKFNGWCYSPPQIDQLHFEKAVIEILNNVKELNRLSEVTKYFEAQITCAIDKGEEQFPSLYLSRETVKRLSGQNCSIDIDVN